MFAVTPRLLLRPGWPEDRDSLFAAINDETVIRNLASAPWPYRREDAAHFLAMSRSAIHPNFLIFSRNGRTPVLLGGIGLDDQDEGHPELGYWIARDHWGCGYATEAGRAVLDIAGALGHREISAEHFSDNPASGQVLRKLGFRPTGRCTPRYSKGRGLKADTVRFSLSLSEDEAADEMMRDIAA
ncbi:GNAT family N-acetyltransferase [uncultured Parasphingorhabdus sp.]|uniref:GNAT family N-acetyltransferase n=1 Tax=uncultured Parasphingorhabdus sp. TaxID=2709694 RepID=UPI002AA7C4F4|nr:GNAT family N-acetyltransferase [uncultured Parasphingorhabdus sp.]